MNAGLCRVVVGWYRAVGGGIARAAERYIEGAPSPVGGARKIGDGGARRHGEGPKRAFMVAHIKESALIESLRGVCSSLLIWLNIPD